jgi:predicted CXXCH cytochrome family protein
MTTRFVLTVVFLLSAAAVHAQQKAVPVDQCVTCHDTLAAAKGGAAATAFRTDVHRARGFTCVDCHGGDSTAADAKQAKDPSRGYRGIPTGAKVIETCARCHSDAELMRRYAPRQRVDQATEYASSVHGKRLAGGDTRVATCVSCHGAHGVRQVSDAKSPVFPTHVAETCARCHSDAERMKPYAPLPTNQHAEYQKSVHYHALTKRNDLSAPTCNDCHGNHGAAPPGVGSVANVCGTCHAVFQARFESSVHKDIFERGCVECHGNHAVAAGSDELLGTSKQAICVSCHSDGDNGFKAAAAMRAGIERLKLELTRGSDVTARVQSAGMDAASQEQALEEAQNQLTVARTDVHAVDVAALDRVLAGAHKNLAAVTQANDRALGELRFRRAGLIASLVAILVFVVALGLKIRDVDRRRNQAPGFRDQG